MLVLALLVASLASGFAQAQDCIDYGGDYLHRMGNVDTPGGARDVAVAGSYAYVADMYSGLQVIDISNPQNPEIVGSVDIDALQQAYDDVVLSGTYAYVATIGSQTALQVIDISNPRSPQIVGSVEMPSDASAVAVSETHAYVMTYDDGLQVVDISDPVSPRIVGSIALPGSAKCVAVSDGHAYVDGIPGLNVIDISNPQSPEIVGSVDTPSTHGVAVSGTYAYVTDGESGLLVLDIRHPESPQIVGSVDFDTPGPALGVAVSGSYAYVADGDSGLQMIDIGDPQSPEVVGSIATRDWASGVAVSGTYAYVADGDSGLLVIDISNPQSPPIVGGIATPGWARRVAVSDSFAYVVGEHSGFQVIHISDPQSPEIVGSIATSMTANDVAVSGSYAYVTGESGFQVIDTTNPQSPQVVGRIVAGMTDYFGEVAVSRRYAYVAGGYRDYHGLLVIDISNPQSPEIVGSVDTWGYTHGVAVSGRYAYVADGDSGLQVIDISDPRHPRRVGSVDTPGHAQDVAVSGSYAYLADGAGLHVIDIWHPAAPVVVGSVDTTASSVAVAGSCAYVLGALGSNRSFIQVVDISNQALPTIIGSADTPGFANDVAVAGSNAYVADGESGLQILPAQCTEPVPELALGVLQNPYLTENLDLYLVGSAPLDPATVRLNADGMDLAMDTADPTENVWGGHYELTENSTSVSLRACASNTSGGNACTEREFAAALLRRGVGGTATSPDGRVTLAVEAPGLVRDGYAVVMREESRESGSSYAISPQGLLGGTHATLTMRFTAAEVGDPTGLYIEEESRGPLESVVDPVRQTVMAIVSELGTFRLVVGPSGSSPIQDRRLLKVEQNVPNPFNPRTTVRFATGERQRVRVSVYDPLGKEVVKLLDQVVGAGAHEVVWDGRSAEGRAVASGVYLYRIETEEASIAQKMLLIK